MNKKQFLPVSPEDLKERGIDKLDFVYVCGDAYVDHPSFGHAIICRILEAAGFTVGIIPQPDWHSTDDFKKLGCPKYGFLVSSGNIDSMVNRYTVNKKIRSKDMYSPGGASGKRPDRAVIVYCNRIREVERMTKSPDFKGNIHDVVGSTANFSGPACDKQLTKGTCKDRQCLFPKTCPAIKASHREYAELLRKIRRVKGVKRVFIRSGIRYDYLMLDKDNTFFKELCANYVSGQLRAAPEHISDRVLNKMGKPPRAVYDKFCEKFYSESRKIGKQQYVVPYLMSSHPGSTLDDAIELALYMKKHNLHPEQVQDFYPTPFTKSTCMFYTGINPDTMEEVYVPKTNEEKKMQRALLQYSKKENRSLAEKALITAGRQDLIGFGSGCLIRPDSRKNRKQEGSYEDFGRKSSVGENKGRTGGGSRKNERGRRSARAGGDNRRR